MTVHLVNPSHLSFGVGVITPRWLFVLAAATPAACGQPRIADETLETLDIDTIQPGDIVGIGIHTGNALRGYEESAQRRGARGDRRLRRHPRHALSRRGARTRRRARGRQGRRRRGVAARARGRACRARCSRCMTADGSRPIASSPARWDLLPRGPVHVGLGADRARLPEALFVLLGVAHRRPEAAPARASTASSTRLSSCAAAASASSRWPTTTSTRSRWPIWRWRSGSTTWRALEQLRALRAERFELMERLAELPSRHGVLHADHHGSGRGSSVPRRHAAREHQGRAGRRRGRHA